MAVGEVDPPRDAVKVGFGDDLYELLNASLRVDVLDVGLVLGERFNNVQRYSSTRSLCFMQIFPQVPRAC